MLEWMNANISLTTLIWLFPITFLLHDFEEIIFVESWFKKNFSKVEPKVPNRMKTLFYDLSKTTAARFSIPVFMQFILYIIASYLAAEKDMYHLFLGLNVIIFLHVFSHVGQTIFFGTYALGVGSALLVTLPYSLYLFYRFLAENIVGMMDIMMSLPFGIITVLIVWFGHEISPKILPDK
ncbi:HXXEE domain-containing protein [Bacillus sp. IITD106]|nr:HXXEE domain-containing protein [Bacillus sp. IITD106]